MRSETLSSAASPAEPKPTELTSWLTPGHDLLESVRLSLETRYPVESDEEEEQGPAAETSPLRGMQIAFAAFVPTFLVVFLGLPYLLPQASTPPSITLVTVSSGPPQLPSPSVAVPLERWTAASPDLLEAWLTNGAWANNAAAVAPRRDGAEARPIKSISADTPSWVRAAAFADEEAAARLAAGMRSQGYRVDLRHEDSAVLPWVVWVSRSPSPSRSAK